MKTYFLILLCTITTVAYSQQQIKFSLKNSCNIEDVKNSNDAQYGFKSSAKANSIVAAIMDAVGLQSNFQVTQCNVDNAAAVLYENTRIIAYSEVYIEKKLTESKNSYWTAYFVFAHEIAHHLNGDALSVSSPECELKADKFAGRALHMLGASLDETLAWAQTCNEKGSLTHPPRSARKEAIINGWNSFNGGNSNVTKTSSKAQEIANEIKVYTRYSNVGRLIISIDVKNEYKNLISEVGYSGLGRDLGTADEPSDNFKLLCDMSQEDYRQLAGVSLKLVLKDNTSVSGVKKKVYVDNFR